MKAIMLMFDSLNRNMLSSYGCDWTKTPNFKRLAERTVTFDNSYVGSMPCMPARRELHTGRLNFLHRSWGPLEPFDDSMPQILQKAGVYTHMISDHYHYWEDGGATYHHRYNSYEMVRGHEGDKWKGQVKEPEMPEHLGQSWRQDVVNRSYMKKEEDQPQPNVFKLGLEFLEKNKNDDNWFLHLETFDPHEPFYTMQKYKDMYPHDWKGPLFDWPPYRKVTEGRDAVEHVRYEYAALLSMCDAWLGKLLDFMDANNMWKDTLLIINTDHGFLLGEHECWAKCAHPFYNEIARTPFFIWDPRSSVKGERRQALVQTIDIAPTLLDFFNQPIPADVQGKSLGDTVKSDSPVREGALFGLYGAQINVTDGKYVYMRDPTDSNKPLFEYTHMPTHMRGPFTMQEMSTMTAAPGFTFTKGAPVMKIDAIMGFLAGTRNPKFGTKLFDVQKDPGQENPLDDKETEERMIRLMVKLMKENDSPPEQFARMGLEKYL